jgi:tetratricopeptide (TPR) repeat protein
MPRIKISRPAERELAAVLTEGLPESFAQLADIYRLDRRFEEAESVCREGLRKFPDYGSGHIVLALVHRDRGEVEKALIEFHSALKCEPGNLLALKSIADIHWDSEAYSLARSYYRQVLQRDRYCTEAQERARRNPRPEKKEETEVEELEREFSVSDVPESERGVFDTLTLAKLYMRQGHAKLAREVCRSILDTEPQNEMALAFLDEINSNTESVKR